MDAIDAADDRVSSACVVVVADKCSDGTADAARRAFAVKAGGRDDGGLGLRSTHVIEIDRGNVGTARAIGVAYGRQALGKTEPSQTWTANTDADTCVPQHWITAQLDWADLGVAAVAGVVCVDSFAEHPPIVAERFASTYTAQLPDDTRDHIHVHGANLGVRLDAYLHAGGWQQLELSEDHDLWNRLRAYGHPVRSPSSLFVTTSGRALSRCPGGFADSLRAHGIGSVPSEPARAIAAVAVAEVVLA